jgi:hypothetical protein
MNDETYRRMMEARAVTLRLQTELGYRVITRSLAELGELSVSLPGDVPAAEVDRAVAALHRLGYAVTCAGFNGEREVRVAALGW